MMPVIPLDLIAAATLSLTLGYYLWSRNRITSCLPLPPGPKKLPIIGNLLDLPSSDIWITYAQWCKQYNSDIIHVQAAGKDMIILDSYKVVSELLDQKWTKYSCRPGFTFISELAGWKWVIPLMPYGEAWKESRRILHRYLMPSNASEYRPKQLAFVHQMLPRLLDAPQNFMELTSHMVGGMVLSMTYGIPIKSSHDPWVALSKRAVSSVTDAATPGAVLVDLLPFLKYVPAFFPGAGFQRAAKEMRVLQESVRELPFAETIRNLSAGTARPSYTSACLEDLDGSKDLHHQHGTIKDTAANMYLAAVETTVSAIHTFFFAMMRFPDIQRKAQEQINSVVGQERLPNFSDEKSLPYISAVMKEILRWQPVVRMTIQRCREDDVHKGYHIPKDSIMLVNIWSMLSQEDDYPDPSSFNPERFLKDGELDSTVRDPATIAFGFGRRICPGSHFALSTLWLTLTSVLAAFTISKPVDNDGLVIEPTVEYTSRLVTTPLPFKCTVKPRSQQAELLIRALAASEED